MGGKFKTADIKGDHWGSRIGLVLAMAGNAVGFGNFLRFPVQAVQNGGGAFIIPYLVCLVLLGFPLLMIEWSVGRYGGKFGHHSTPFILHSMSNKAIWKYVGVFGLFSNLAIAAYYCYIESWTISYIFHTIIGTFDQLSRFQVADFFDGYTDVAHSTTGIPYEALVFYVLCLALNSWILSRGLAGGVEKASKIGVPLLIVFGIFLAIKAITLKAGSENAVYDGMVGLSFLWTPQFDSLTNPKVWLAAAGQIFFTLSVGMGSIQCYASYLRERDDIAVNAMSAGFMNEFVEIVLGSSVIIPISIGYLGVDKVVDLVGLGGLGLAFRTMPFLFEQWGSILSVIAGVAFFGLLFFAGITSSLAMGTPIVGFLKDEFKFSNKKAALTFALVTLSLGLPVVLFFQQGVFDEFDYWAGTVALFIFAMFESILFSWFFGADKGWKEFLKGADMKLPGIFRYILKYVTPILLIIVFVTSLIRPAKDDWSSLSFKGWELHPESILGQITYKGILYNKQNVADVFYSENSGIVDSIYSLRGKNYIRITPEEKTAEYGKNYVFKEHQKILVQLGDVVKAGQPILQGRVINRILYIKIARFILLTLFIGLSILVHLAYRNRKKYHKI